MEYLLLFKKIVFDLKARRVKMVSASLSFLTFLSLIPLIAILISILKWVGWLNDFVISVQPMILSYVSVSQTDETVALIGKLLEDTGHLTLGFTSLMFLSYTSISIIRQVDMEIQLLWDIDRHRSWRLRWSSYWVVVMFGPLIFSLMLIAVSGNALDRLFKIPVPGLFFALQWFVLFLIYQFVPNKKVKWNYSLPVSAVVAISMGLLQWIVFWISRISFTGNQVYGALAAVPVFLIWLQSMWVLFFLGVYTTRRLQQVSEALSK